MRVAIVSDFLEVYAGAERVLEQMVKCYPEADIFSLVDFVPAEMRGFLQGKTVRITFIQKLPFARKYFRHYLPLWPMAIESLDVSSYDLVISSSHAVAKGVKTGPHQTHVCYCHSPARYAWDMREQYLAGNGMQSGLKQWIASYILERLRKWDQRTANRVDHFISNTNFVAQRIEKYYQRQAAVIFPPVNVDGFTIGTEKEPFYLAASRLVAYKRIDLVVDAFISMPKKKLVVIGDGPKLGDLRERAKGAPNIMIMGYQSFAVLKDHLQRCQAFVFPALEDCGIIPIEAQACGTPVIAYGVGGVCETVIDHPDEQATGMFFNEQAAAAISDAVIRFESEKGRFNPKTSRKNAERFSEEIFRKKFSGFIDGVMKQPHTP